MNRMNSKYLSLLLRHKPEKENLILDEYGWCDVKDLLEKLNISIEELDHIVSTNNKKRFRYNEDRSKIKASQGHSIKIKDDFKRPTRIPPYLYHGTIVDNLKSIMRDGLIPMRRNHVHLSGDLKTAISVGMRHAKKGENLLILKINSLNLHQHHPIFISDNEVYLVDSVPPKFIEVYEF